MKFPYEKVLVTGGAGFIGSNIVKALLEMSVKVRVVDNFSTGRKQNIMSFLHNKKFELIEGDLRNYNLVESAVIGVECILHQGALPSVSRSIDDPITSNDVNIHGTLNVLEAAKRHGIKRVIYASSSSVYGNSTCLPKNEDMLAMPMSPYALTKHTAEKYCQIYYQLYGLETICLRYFNVFGPNQDPSSQYSAVISKFINLMKKGMPPTIYGDGKQSRDFTFVENNVEANLLACMVKKAGGQVFNIACGQSYTVIELVQQINKILGTKIEPVFSSERLGEVKHSLADIKKAKELLGFKPKVDFLAGLIKTVEYFKV